MYKMPDGREVLRTWDLFEKREGTPDIPIRNPTILGQDRVEEILRNYIARFGCQVELGKELIDIQQDASAVTAQIRVVSESKDIIENFRASYVVGADGAKGTVRKLIGLKFLGETQQDADTTVFGDVKLSNIDADHCHIWREPKASVTLRPMIPGDTTAPYQFVITGHSSDPQSAIQPEILIKFVHEFTKRTELEFKEFLWISNFRPNIRMVNKFSEGRIFVVGDAAHVSAPTGGQGLNSGVQDSCNLAWKLALVYKGLANPKLLDTYNDERLPVIAEMLRQTTGLYNSAFGKDRKDTESQPFSEWAKNKALFMLGINYRWSSIVFDERGPSELDEETLKANSYGGYDSVLGAGDRAPEAPNLRSLDSNKEVSLFDIFKPTMHTVLIFVTKSTYIIAHEAVEVTNSLPAGSVYTVILTSSEGEDLSIPKASTVLFDSKAYARKHYNVGSDEFTVVVVRPDGYIGGICKSADGIKKYFSGIFNCTM